MTPFPQYRIYIDESGDHTYKHLDNYQNRYLGLVGCIVAFEHYRIKLQPDLEGLKQKYFHYNPNDPVILVRQRIVSKSGSFWVLRDEKTRKEFNEDLLQFINDHNFIVISVVIDKKRHIETYGTSAYHPYHFSVSAMMERYAGLLNYKGRHGDSMAESRAGQDKFLKEAYRHLFTGGTLFRSPDFFQNALTSTEIKLELKSANIAGLQLADLLAHPCKEEILIERGLIEDNRGNFTKEFRKAIEKKYNRHLYTGRIEGYGKIFLI